jgi:hypothetical protein
LNQSSHPQPLAPAAIGPLVTTRLSQSLPQA